MVRKATTVKFEMNLPQELDRQVQEWRRAQPDLPTRNEALRRLVRKGLDANREAGKAAPGTER